MFIKWINLHFSPERGSVSRAPQTARWLMPW